MKVCVISSSPFVAKNDRFYAYSPYVKELDIWASHADEIAFMCPVWHEDRGLLISEIAFPVTKLYEARAFNVKSFAGILNAIRYSFLNFYLIFQAMRWADHIHLRCPGNIGLMGCLVQIFFPKKPKTAKYAGNWDPNAKQPTSYQFQKWILANTFLTKNMQVLVYGEWKGSSKNIRPFFTATYKESEKVLVAPRKLDEEIKLLFVGTLAPGKRPLYAIKVVENLVKQGCNASLSIYGGGREMPHVLDYIEKNNCSRFIHYKGNQPEAIVRTAYQNSHFLILPSKSEGWPKVVAEAMFWGCIPLASSVSCVPFMLGHGNRGLILDIDLNADTDKIMALINDPAGYEAKVEESMSWSRKYTLDLFDNEIKALLNQ